MKNKKQKKYSSPQKARDLLRRLLFRQLSHKEQTGFSLFELVVVVAVLGILSSIAITSFRDQVKWAQVDEAKALLNSAAAECLQTFRAGGDMGATPNALSTRGGALPGNYEYGCREGDTNLDCGGDTHNSCNFTAIHDPTSNVSLLIDLKFWVTGKGKLAKEAGWTDPETENACNSWGGCGGNECGRIMKACGAVESECDANLASGLKSGRGLIAEKAFAGQCACPEPVPAPNCKADGIQVWSCEGVAKYSQESYDACVRANDGIACTNSKDELKDMGHDGPTPDAYVVLKSESSNGCNVQIDGTSPTWWFNGQGDYTESTYESAACGIEKDKWIGAGGDGEFSPDLSSYYGTFKCPMAYKCDGILLDSHSAYTAPGACGNACNNAKNAFIDKGVDGILLKTDSDCPQDFYLCKGNLTPDKDDYEKDCGAKPASTPTPTPTPTPTKSCCPKGPSYCYPALLNFSTCYVGCKEDVKAGKMKACS